MNKNSEQTDGISRRTALQIGAAGCTSAVVATSLVGSGDANLDLGCDRWNKLVGQDVQVLRKSFEAAQFRPVAMQLVHVSKDEIQPQAGSQLPNRVSSHLISLEFKAERRCELPSSTYEVALPGVGKRHLFINQIVNDQDATSRLYQAIIG